MRYYGGMLTAGNVRAGFGIRVAASLIDVAIVLLPILVVMVPGWYFWLKLGSSERGAERLMGAIASVLLLAYSFSEVLFAGTPGKKFLKMRITNPDGSDASRAALTLRWLTKNSSNIWSLLAAILNVPALDWLANLMALLIFIGCLMVLRESKLAWHDEWARTAVYRPAPAAEKRGFEPVMITPTEGVSSSTYVAEQPKS